MPPNFSPLRAHHPACSLKRESLNPPATPDHDELTSRGDQGCQMSPFSYSRFPLQGSLTQKRQWHQPANWKKKIGSFFSSKTSPNLTITPLLSLSPWLLSLQHEPTFWCCSITGSFLLSYCNPEQGAFDSLGSKGTICIIRATWYSVSTLACHFSHKLPKQGILA